MRKYLILYLNLLIFLCNGQDKKPNIILILADDLSPAYLGCYGGNTPTPELDKLAKEGVKFNNAHAATPLCNPSRYTLLTGQYAGRNKNVYENVLTSNPYFVGQNTKWTANDPSIARTLKNVGYYTGFVGKWHSNFEDFPEGEGMPAGLNKDELSTTQLLQKIQATQSSFVKQIGGFDVASNLQFGNLDKKDNWMGYHNPEWITQGALDFIDEASKKKKPFYLHLANSVPHSPDIIKILDQPNKYSLSGKANNEYSCHPPRSTVAQRLQNAGLNTSGPLASINAGAIMLDDQLGAIRKKLQELGIAENTLIIWVADHSIYGKGTCYTSGTKVPMIMHWPKNIQPGTQVDVSVSLIDIFKTTMEAAKANTTTKNTDGESLMPLIKGTTKSHAPLYQEVNWFRSVTKGKYHYVAFRPPSGMLKLMQDGTVDFAIDNENKQKRDIFGDLNLPFKPHYFDPDQLYDLEMDSLERQNLAYHPAYKSILEEMKQELIKYTNSFSRPFHIQSDPYMMSIEYAQKVINRKKMAKQKEHYPEKYDAELIYNLNLKDPLSK